MSVSSLTARLCKQIIKQHFGDVVEEIATILLSRGRLSIKLIKKYTTLNEKRIKNALFILMQHDLVTHATQGEGRFYVPYYTLEIENVIDRLFMLGMMKMAKERYGRQGYLITRTFFLNGKLKFKDVEGYLEKVMEASQKVNGKVNGDSNIGLTQENSAEGVNDPSSTLIQQNVVEESSEDYEPITSTSLRNTFLTMVLDRFLSGATVKQTFNKKDLELDGVQQLLNSGQILKTKKEKERIIEEFKAQQIKQDDSNDIKGTKRKHGANGLGGRVNTNLLDDDKELNPEDYEIEEDAYFVLNFKRAKIFLRDQQIVEFTYLRINDGAGEVMKAFTKAVENKVVDIKDEHSPSINNYQINKKLDAESQVHKYIKLENMNNGIINGNGNERIKYVTELVNLINQDEHQVLKDSQDSMGYHYIDYSSMGNHLKLKFIENYIKFKFGIPSARLFKMIFNEGKIDEGFLIKVSVMAPFECRKRLNQLLSDGLITLQEVPRSALREPKRSIFLWEIKLNKTFVKVQENILKSISNTIDRRYKEIQSKHILLKKIQREDVKKDLNLLPSVDKQALLSLNHNLEMLDYYSMQLYFWFIVMKWY